MGVSLRNDGYDQAILLPNSWKSALIPYFANIPKRTGWLGEFRHGLLNDKRRLDKNQYPLMAQRFVALAYEANQALPEKVPYPRLQSSQQAKDDVLNVFGIDSAKPLLALCPGAEFGEAKRWPVEHYAACAQAKIAEGWQVCLLGSGNDQSVTQQIIKQLPEDKRQYCYDLAGQTQLSQVIDLLSLANLVISNDSGLMHIAAALGSPLVAVYGSTSPDFTPPLSACADTVAIPVDCGPCFQRQCVHQEASQQLKCLRGVTPENVLAVGEQVMDKARLKEQAVQSKQAIPRDQV